MSNGRQPLKSSESGRDYELEISVIKKSLSSLHYVIGIVPELVLLVSQNQRLRIAKRRGIGLPRNKRLLHIGAGVTA